MEDSLVHCRLELFRGIRGRSVLAYGPDRSEPREAEPRGTCLQQDFRHECAIVLRLRPDRPCRGNGHRGTDAGRRQRRHPLVSSLSCAAASRTPASSRILSIGARPPSQELDDTNQKAVYHGVLLVGSTSKTFLMTESGLPSALNWKVAKRSCPRWEPRRYEPAPSSARLSGNGS